MKDRLVSMIYEERPSDSPYIESIGHFCVEDDYSHICPASVFSNILIVSHNGETTFTVWGPETQSGLMSYPKDAEFLFIRFKLGSFMPDLPTRKDKAIFLPDAASQKFWLNGAVWQFPTYENADTFVDWLVRDGLLAHEPVVDAVLRDHPPTASSSTVRHRFLRATGLTRSYIRQLEQAQQAAALLGRGVSILDTVDQTGYADQPHLTRSLKRYIGYTPAQIARLSQPE